MKEEKDIDLVELLKVLIKRRKVIIITTLSCFCIGVFLAIFSPRVFKAQCIFVPQTNQSFSASKYSSIASMIGMDLDISGNDGPISPRVYPCIFDNAAFLKELIYTPIHFRDSAEPYSFYEYMTEPSHQKFNIVKTVEKYTIGLPFLIMYAILPDRHESDLPKTGFTIDSTLVTLTKKEAKVAKTLSKNIKLDVDSKKGVLTMTVTMPEALASAEMCQASYDLLKRYVVDFKLARSRKNLAFIEQQYEEVKADYEKKQRQAAYFIDSHQGMMTAAATVEKVRYESEAELAKQLYSELAKNLLSSRVKLEESNVAFTDLAPVAVPTKKFKPRGSVLCLIWTFLGLAGSCGYALIASGRKKED